VDNVLITEFKVALASTGAELCINTTDKNAIKTTVTEFTSTCTTTIIVGTSYNVVVVGDSGVFSANLLAK